MEIELVENIDTRDGIGHSVRSNERNLEPFFYIIATYLMVSLISAMLCGSRTISVSAFQALTISTTGLFIIVLVGFLLGLRQLKRACTCGVTAILAFSLLSGVAATASTEYAQAKAIPTITATAPPSDGALAFCREMAAIGHFVAPAILANPLVVHDEIPPVNRLTIKANLNQPHQHPEYLFWTDPNFHQPHQHSEYLSETDSTMHEPHQHSEYLSPSNSNLDKLHQHSEALSTTEAGSYQRIFNHIKWLSDVSTMASDLTKRIKRATPSSAAESNISAPSKASTSPEGLSQ